MKSSKLFYQLINMYSKYFLIGNVRGIDNLKVNRPSILIANHSSYLDHFVMIYLFKKYNPNKNLYFLTKKEAFDHYLSRKWHRDLNSIPIDREDNDTVALQKLKDIIDNKKGSVVIYPEGTRTQTGFIGTPKLGAAFLSMMTNAPIIPVSFHGIFDVLPKYTKIPKIKKVDVVVNKPITFKKQNKEKLQKSFNKVWNILVNNTNEYNIQDINLIEAARFYNEKGIRNYPENILNRIDMHKRAIYLTNILINNNKDLKESYLEKARAYGRLGIINNSYIKRKYYYKLAKNNILKSLSIDNKYGPAYYAKATLDLWENNIQEAIREYKYALKLMPNTIYVEIALAKTLKKNNQFEEAKYHFEKIISRHPQSNVDIRRKHEAEALLMRLDEKIIV